MLPLDLPLHGSTATTVPSSPRRRRTVPARPPDLGRHLHPPGTHDAHKYPHESHTHHGVQGDHADEHLPDDHRQRRSDHVVVPPVVQTQTQLLTETKYVTRARIITDTQYLTQTQIQQVTATDVNTQFQISTTTRVQVITTTVQNNNIQTQFQTRFQTVTQTQQVTRTLTQPVYFTQTLTSHFPVTETRTVVQTRVQQSIVTVTAQAQCGRGGVAAGGGEPHEATKLSKLILNKPMLTYILHRLSTVGYVTIYDTRVKAPCVPRAGVT
nr:uncharacterized protein LOC113803719 [Penaeus vannamei]